MQWSVAILSKKLSWIQGNETVYELDYEPANNYGGWDASAKNTDQNGTSIVSFEAGSAEEVTTIAIEKFDQSGQYLGTEEIEVPELPEDLHYKSYDEKSFYFNVDGTGLTLVHNVANNTGSGDFGYYSDSDAVVYSV